MSGLQCMGVQHCGRLGSSIPCRVSGLGSSGSSLGAAISLKQFRSFPSVVPSHELLKGGGSPHNLTCGNSGVLEIRRIVRCQAFSRDEFRGSDPSGPDASVVNPGSSTEQTFFDRLVLAWNILFPRKRKSTSYAEIAKQRLKMILISDRCSVNDDAKRKIVNKIVGALSDFVEIESEDRVQLTVSSDIALGTLYSITVPVRRVKPEFQDYSREIQNVALAEEFDDEYRTLDIRLEYQYPDDAVDFGS